MSNADSKGWVYVVQMGPGGPVKIGYSKNPYTRINHMRTSWPYEPIVLAVFAGDRDKEREIHHRMRKYRMRGEWFLPAQEVLNLAATCHDLKTGYERESPYLSNRRHAMPCGEKHWMSKLTDSQVEEIRRDTRPKKVIAADYGISRPQVSRIKSGTSRRL